MPRLAPVTIATVIILRLWFDILLSSVLRYRCGKPSSYEKKNVSDKDKSSDKR